MQRPWLLTLVVVVMLVVTVAEASGYISKWLGNRDNGNLKKPDKNVRNIEVASSVSDNTVVSASEGLARSLVDKRQALNTTNIDWVDKFIKIKHDGGQKFNELGDNSLKPLSTKL